MPALLAALLALALTNPADAARRKAKPQPSTFCQPYDEPGVNPNALTCARRVR